MSRGPGQPGRADGEDHATHDRDPWDVVAAPGTDPDLLAAVVRRAAVDRTGLAAQWRRLVADEVRMRVAVRQLAAAPVLEVGPGDAQARTWRRQGVVVTLAGDPDMPERLVRHGVAPPWLALRGTLEPSVGPAVAIVGARRATGYGTGVAAWLAEEAAQAGVRVVSGGAVGIDAAAHTAAMGRAGGTTVVLGCGHDVAYPRPHARDGGLFARVLDAGGVVLSEGLPGDPPRAHRVRARNRLVAALADAIVVVEGGARSGSLVTAGWGADLGIPVLAVPGDVRAPGSAASHQLLREGAGVCTGPADVLSVVLEGAPDGRDVEHRDGRGDPAGLGTSGLPGWLHDRLVAAWPRPVPVTRLVEEGGSGSGPVLAALTRAQVAGTVTRDVDGVRLCRRPADA